MNKHMYALAMRPCEDTYLMDGGMILHGKCPQLHGLTARSKCRMGLESQNALPRRPTKQEAHPEQQGWLFYKLGVLLVSVLDIEAYYLGLYKGL